MSGTDEYIVRELMQRGTADLHAPSTVTARIISQHRRRRLRNRAVGAAMTGAAAGTVITIVASAPGGVARSAADGAPGHGTTVPNWPGPPATVPNWPGPPATVPNWPGPPATAPALRLTATQTALYRLSSAAAAAPRPAGRYVVMAEKQDNYDRTSVLDSLTGDVWTYQRGAGVPSELPVARHDSPTEAAFDAMPTDPPALRALLLTQARQQQAQAIAEEQRMLAAHGKKAIPRQPHLTDDDNVFEQATTMLWNPLVGPELRAALYKVLAATPGVQVTETTDMTGRPAMKISRFDSAADVIDETFQNPATGGVLETAFVYPANKTQGTDLYLSVTSSNTLPPNPYAS